MHIYMQRPCPWFVASARDSCHILWPRSVVLFPFPELSGGASPITVAGGRTPGNVSCFNVIATQITWLRLLPFCRFVKEKRPFPGDFLNFWILYQYFSHYAPPPYSFFLLLLQEYHCPSLRDTIHPPVEKKNRPAFANLSVCPYYSWSKPAKNSS